ncbi:Transmembrane protein 26 [Holothuria leucospilota]|uniref:Transmembrane protein 26 n=1 Tax=Holothuria leucospilota TaxID=206669 RepID=A0A9Q1CIF0_HOLLE|nr:Transmembrane protein 26 [Holothuria leucospilota]
MKKIIKIVKALLARLLFAAHGLVGAWKVASSYGNFLCYFLLVPILLLPIEFFITFKFTEEGEWKWFCPSVCLYLLSVAPGLWLMQLHLYRERIDYRDAAGWDSCTLQTNYSTQTIEDLSNGNIPALSVSDSEWTLALEQLLVILLIVGRWLLPKGKLTRDQLSQLLLVYIGMAADILEFSAENLKESAVYCDLLLIIIILALWSWSLIQFTLVLTSVAARRGRNFSTATSRSQNFCDLCFKCGCCANEIWSLMITIIMQDGPFLVMRLYLIINRRVFNQMMMFFTLKNLLVFSLQVYRIGILCCSVPNEVEPAEEPAADALTVTDVEKGETKETEIEEPVPAS